MVRTGAELLRELRVQHPVDVVGGYPEHGLGMREVNRRIVDHVDRHPERRPACPLADPRLEHPQLALLDCELGIAHVAVVRLEPGEDLHQLWVDRGELPFDRSQWFGVAYAGHDVFSLGVHEEVAVGALGARGRVPGEADTRAGLVVPVAEHHRLDVDRRAEIVRDPFPNAVGDRPRPVPGGEDGFDGAAKLVDRVLRERVSCCSLDDGLQLLDECLQVGCGQLGVRRTRALLQGVERAIELVAGDAQHYAAVHLHKTPVRVEREPLVTGLLGEAHDRPVIEAQVQDGVHHARHRELRSRSHRDQQRVVRVTQLPAHARLEPG